jgi:transitional endoplasmic reticulum ATPase
MEQIIYKAFEYQAQHIGLNVAIVPDVNFNDFRQMTESDPIYVEITSTNNDIKAYGYAWHEVNDKFQEEDSAVRFIGLEKPLMDTCLISPGDIVEVRPLKQHEIKNAINLELQVLGEEAAKIQTEEDLQAVKNRILAGEVILSKESRFLVPLQIAGVTHNILFHVVQAEPGDAPIRCNDKTTIEFRGIHVKTNISTVNFKYIGGLKKQISLLQEVIQLPLEHPDVFAKLGINPPRGILLYGPPGNGKTMLARAFASSIKANFFTINGPELMSRFVGQGEQKLREVFEKAQNNAPSIIFFDEIDSFAGTRDAFTADFEVRMVGQLLSLMDGLTDRGNVIIIAATNRPNSIDTALRRPGRFDREIEVSLPDEWDRLDILLKYVRNIDLDSDVDIQSWAKKTSGYVGADLAALVREAAIRCLRRVFQLSPDGRYVKKADVHITNEDFVEAFKELQPTNLRDLPSQVESVSWHEIIGANNIKDRLINLIETPLKNPKILKEVGLKPPTGIILVGSSQSDNKSLILALADKLSIQCIYVRALDFIKQNQSNSGQKLPEMFRKARLSSPSIILIDKIDLAFSTQLRETSESFLFSEDLVDEIKRNRLYENVFVIATALNIESLPATLLEASVFGHILHIPLPSVKDSEAFIQAKLNNYFPSNVDYHDLAKAVEGLSSGEVIYVCEEFLRMYLSNDGVTAIDFKKAAQIVKEGKVTI